MQPARFFNVIVQGKGRAGSQFLCGQDELLAKRVAADESASMKKGESVTLWFIDKPSDTVGEIQCIC